MKKLTREQILELRKSFEVWQQDYDSVHDKEQHDMFALGVAAMNEILAAMDSQSVVVTNRMALDFHSAITDGAVGNDDVEEIKTGLRAALANISVPFTNHERREWMARGVDALKNIASEHCDTDCIMDRHGISYEDAELRANGAQALAGEIAAYAAKIRAGEVDL